MNKNESIHELSTLIADALTLHLADHKKESTKSLHAMKNSVDEGIRHQLLLLKACMQRGKTFFLRYGFESNASAIFKRVDAKMSHINETVSSSRGMTFIDEKDYKVLFDIAFSVYEKDKLEDAAYMMSVLSLLQPLHVQPYILLGTITWRQKGCADACQIYSSFIQVLKDPLLYYYAADCYYHHKEKAKAKELLNEAAKMCKNLHSVGSDDLLKDIQTYLKQF